MTPAHHRRAMRQVRCGEVVVDAEVAGVCAAVAGDAVGGWVAALVFAGTTTAFTGQALLTALPTALRVLDVVVAASAALVVVLLRVVVRARGLLRSHPDPAAAGGVAR